MEDLATMLFAGQLDITSDGSIPRSRWNTTLFCIQRRYRPSIVDLHTTPLLLLTVLERQSPASLTLRYRQPQSHQMPPLPLLPHLIETPRRVIRIGRPRMKDMAITQQLHVARFQNHMQRQLRARLLPHLQRMFLLLTQGRDLRGRTGVKSRKRCEIHRIKLRVKPTFSAAAIVGLHVQDRRPNPLLFAFADFPFTIEVPDWFRHELDDLWMPLL